MADLSPIDQAIAQRDKLQQQLVRTAADFDNYRKRARRDAEEASRRSKEEVLREVLPFVDNLERAVAAADNATDAKAVADGVRMVLRMFGDTAQRLGLDRIPSVGERFDPNLHDAIQQEETEEHPPGTIVREISSGYRFGPRLLRPAVVVVARPPASPSTEIELPTEADPLSESPTLEDPLPEPPEEA